MNYNKAIALLMATGVILMGWGLYDSVGVEKQLKEYNEKIDRLGCYAFVEKYNNDINNYTFGLPTSETWKPQP